MAHNKILFDFGQLVFLSVLKVFLSFLVRCQSRTKSPKKKLKPELKASVKSHDCILANSDGIDVKEREREEKRLFTFS